MAIPFSEISDAFDFVSFAGVGEHFAVLDRQTGRFYFHSDIGDNEEELPEDLDDEKYLDIPHKNELGLGKRLVLDFAHQYLPDEVARVHAIFSRRGAYSKFKYLLDQKNLLEKWYAFESEAQEKALREWCAEVSLEVTG